MTEFTYEDLQLTQSLSPQAQKRLKVILKPCYFPAGAFLIRQGDTGESLFLLLSGSVDVALNADTPEERVLGERKAGSFVGEMSLFTPKGKRTADVRAASDVHCLELTYQSLEKLIHSQPDVAFELLRTITRRLKAADDAAIAELRQKNAALEKAYADLAAAQAELVEKERLEKELEVARKIQFSILPSTRPQGSGFSIGACIQPARAVGGDLFDFFMLDDGKIAVSVGDVSDKGVPAAIFMARYCSLLRAIAHPDLSPGATLARVNQLLISRNEPGMFVTVIYGIFDPQSKGFDYARAGHELPILFDAQGHQENVPHQLGQPLGIFEDAVMDEGQIDLKPGSVLFFNSDGASDATTPKGEYFGVARLIQQLQTRLDLEAQPMCDSLLTALNDYRQESAQFDDITLVAIKTAP